MKVLSSQIKTVEGKSYNLIKAWAPKGFSVTEYRSQVESYGSELVHIKKLSGDKAGNVFDVIIAL